MSSFSEGKEGPTSHNIPTELSQLRKNILDEYYKNKNDYHYLSTSPQYIISLSGILQTWKKQNSSMKHHSSTSNPALFGCLFRQSYGDTKKLNRGLLKGADEFLVTAIEPLAARHGFKLAIYRFKYNGRYPSDIAGGVSRDNLALSGQSNDHINLLQLTDLDGMPLSSLDCNFVVKNSHFLGEDLLNLLRKRDTFEAKKLGSNTDRVAHLWIGSALLIWPEITISNSRPGKALPTVFGVLEASSSIVAVTRERTALKELQEWCLAKRSNLTYAEDIRRAFRLLLVTSLRWSDAESFARTISICDPKLKNRETYLSIYKENNAHLPENLFLKVISSCDSNQARQPELILSNLKPCRVDELDWLMNVTNEWGFPFFCTVLLPQLKVQSLTFRKALATRLKQSGRYLPYSTAESIEGTVQELVKKCIETPKPRSQANIQSKSPVDPGESTNPSEEADGSAAKRRRIEVIDLTLDSDSESESKKCVTDTVDEVKHQSRTHRKRAEKRRRAKCRATKGAADLENTVTI
uniref:Uncharacterized protein n=1 Tax=Moniliophthora roreri TaxID=221103 RepID=A0A0W0FF71_MONRR